MSSSKTPRYNRFSGGSAVANASIPSADSANGVSFLGTLSGVLHLNAQKRIPDILHVPYRVLCTDSPTFSI